MALPTVSDGGSYPAVATRLVLLGTSGGLVMQPLVARGQFLAGARHLGTASSVMVTARGFGGALGVAMIGALVVEGLSGSAESLGRAVPQALVLTIPLAALLLLAVAAATRPGEPRHADASRGEPGRRRPPPGRSARA